MSEVRGESALVRGGVMIASAALAVLVAAPAHAADEVHVYGIANFGGSGCETMDMTHSVHTQTAAAFRSPFELFKSAGLWDEVATMNNLSAKGTLFQDATKVATGADSTANAGADEADVLYVHTHAGHLAPSNGSTGFSELVMGNDDVACRVQTHTDMSFGSGGAGGDLDIAVVKACQSGDYKVWLAGGYSPMRTSTSSFTVWNAFHGDSSCGGHVTDYVGDYAVTSMSNGVGENWIDDAYDGAFWPWEDDDCPTSIVWGSSKSARKNMFENGGFRDRKDTGSKTGSTFFFVAGCNPIKGVQLPEG